MPFDPRYPSAIPLEIDGKDYEVLIESVQSIEHILGMTCEIGVRTGGSTKLIVDEIKGKNRTHIGIDPYGGLDYVFDFGTIVTDAYSNKEYRNPSLALIYDYAFKSDVNFVFFNLTSEQFMKRYSDGVPVYDNGQETLLDTYALVYFDGLHTLNTVMVETQFFEARTMNGSILVYDDISLYDHAQIDTYLKDRNWNIKNKTTNKISYQK